MSRALRLPNRSLRKAPLDVAGLRAHCQQQVAQGQAPQTVEFLLDLVGSLARRVDQLEIRLGQLAQVQWGRRSEKLSSAQLALALGEPEPRALLESADASSDSPELLPEPQQPPDLGSLAAHKRVRCSHSHPPCENP